MSVLLIQGSPRKGNSNTLRIVRAVQSGFPAGTIVEQWDAIDQKIPLCLGCNRCFQFGEAQCPHSAQVAPVLNALVRAEAVIVSSPNFMMQVPGALKNIIDHLSFLYHRPRLFGKHVLIITSTAGAGAKGTARYLKLAFTMWGCSPIQTLPVTCFSEPFQPTDAQKTKWAALGTRWVADIHTPRKPSLQNITYYNAMRASAGMRLLETDTQFWEQHGMLGSAFAPGQSIGFAGKLYGNALHGMMRRVMHGEKTKLLTQGRNG